MHTRLACALLFAVGCATDTPHDQHSTALTTWDSMGLSSYSFTWQQQCYCTSEVTRPMRIEVVDGAIAAATYVDDDTQVSAGVRASLLTIEGVFDTIADAIANNAHTVDVKYDPDLGFPLSVAVDYQELLADEELSLQISNVRWSTLAGCGFAPH